MQPAKKRSVGDQNIISNYPPLPNLQSGGEATTAAMAPVGTTEPLNMLNTIPFYANTQHFPPGMAHYYPQPPYYYPHHTHFHQQPVYPQPPFYPNQQFHPQHHAHLNYGDTFTTQQHYGHQDAHGNQ